MQPMTNGNIRCREKQSRAIFCFKRIRPLVNYKYGNAALVNRVVNAFAMMSHLVFLCFDKERLALYGGIKGPVGPGRDTVSF